MSPEKSQTSNFYVLFKNAEIILLINIHFPYLCYFLQIYSFTVILLSVIIKSSFILPPPLLYQESSSLRTVKVKTIIKWKKRHFFFNHWTTTVWLKSSSLCSSETNPDHTLRLNYNTSEKRKRLMEKGKWVSKLEVVDSADSLLNS